MLDVGFILPSSHYLKDPFRGDPFTHFHILTLLEEHFGQKIKVRLPDLRGIDRAFAFYHIPECDVYLHSIYTLDYNEQALLVAMLRRLYPRAVHIAGGPHANEFPEQSLKVFDTLIIGEGEQTIVQALEDFQNNQSKRIYQETGMIDINRYPYPNRSYLPKSVTARRKMMTLKSKPGVYDHLISTNVLFSRGCPYHCSFCALIQARENSPGIRFRTPKLIEEEIEYLKREYGIEGLVLVDEIGIPLNMRMAVPHLEAIGRTSIVWRGQCRVDGITPQIASLARESGCIALGLGLESVSQISLDIINKNINIEQARQTIRILKEHDIEVRLYMIMGLPAEPPDIVEQTWQFISETKPDVVHLSLFTVRPGTELFRHPEKFGIKPITADWDETMHLHAFGGDKLNLTFEYEEYTPWGPSLKPDQIIANYLELLNRLKETGLSSTVLNKSTLPFDDISDSI